MAAHYFILQAPNGLVLASAPTEQHPNTLSAKGPLNAADNSQLWSLEGEYVVNRKTGHVLDVSQEVARPGTAVLAFEKKSGVSKNQQWTFTADGKLLSELRGEGGDLYLDLSGDSVVVNHSGVVLNRIPVIYATVEYPHLDVNGSDLSSQHIKSADEAVQIAVEAFAAGKANAATYSADTLWLKKFNGTTSKVNAARTSLIYGPTATTGLVASLNQFDFNLGEFSALPAQNVEEAQQIALKAFQDRTANAATYRDSAHTVWLKKLRNSNPAVSEGCTSWLYGNIISFVDVHFEGTKEGVEPAVPGKAYEALIPKFTAPSKAAYTPLVGQYDGTNVSISNFSSTKQQVATNSNSYVFGAWSVV